MKQTCKHCGLRFRPVTAGEAFCCSGCEQVYTMIQEGGLGAYYARQDRMGRPIGERVFTEPNRVFIKQLQSEAEQRAASRLNLTIRGMTCLGCVWLIEQIAMRCSGLVYARVALQSNCLRLAWKAGEFDLCAFAEELGKFGYEIIGQAHAVGTALSPLAMRFSLTLLFSMNGIFIKLLSVADFGGTGLRALYEMLIIACMLFALFLGGALFIRPAWRGLMLRKINQDLLPAAFIAVILLLALLGQLGGGALDLAVWAYFICLPLMSLARWQAEERALRAIA